MTSAVITPETKDTPSLSVTISRLSSSSPFPSPGSPFFSPPVPSAHEYAPIPLSKRRSTESRMMNVGSNKTDHESPALADPLVDVSSVPTPTAIGKTSGAVAEPQDNKREGGTKNITGDHLGNGLVGSLAEHPDSKPTVNGQVTTPTAKSPQSTEAGRGAFLSSSEDTTLKVKQSSPDDNNDDGDAGGTTSISLSPSTPVSSFQNPQVATSPATLTESAKPSLDNDQNNFKPPSRNSLRLSRDSLTSSRPAPLSPADSRRTSAALSRHSSTRSRPGSIVSLTPANKHDAEVASPTTPTPTQSQPPQQQEQQQASLSASSSSAVAAPTPASTPMVPVKIRDFAFPDEDVRHAGTGPLTPRPNRRSQRPLSTWSTSSASSAGSSEQDDGTSAGSSHGFTSWGLGRLGWFGARSGTGASAGTDTDNSAGGGPSQRDFARNFTDAMSPEYEADDPYESLDDDDDDDDTDDDGRRHFGGGEESSGEERPLLPGLYRALYVFEPEGTAEMALEEDQIVRVIGRGGGVGWAIVARGGDEGHALVPEGYLELVSLDRDSEQVGERDG